MKVNAIALTAIKGNKSQSFKAQTEKGNHYKKSDYGFSAGAIAGLTVAGYELFGQYKSGAFSGLSSFQKASKIAKHTALLFGIGIAFGMLQDVVINKIRKNRADKNPKA